MVVFATNGFLFATWFSRLPDIKERLDLTPAGLSVLLLGLSVGSLIGLPIAGRVLHRTGATRGVRLGGNIGVIGVLFAAVAVTEQWPVLVAAAGLLVLGIGNGIWDVGQNLEGTVIEQDLGRSIMPWFHAAFSGGTLVAALFAVPLVHIGVPILAHVGVAAVLCWLLLQWGSGQFEPAEPHEEKKERMPLRQAWSEPRTLLIGLMVLAAAFTEGSANDWIAIAFVEGHEVSKSTGVVAFAIFLGFMTAGRLAGTMALDRFGRLAVLRVLFLSAVIGSLMVVFGSPTLAFIGAAIWGIGASLGFPVGMSAAADDPAKAAPRLSVVATIGYLAFLGGPPLLGFLGNQVGVLRSLMVVGLVSILALIVAPAAKPLRVETER
jgi:fucose permease